MKKTKLFKTLLLLLCLVGGVNVSWAATTVEIPTTWGNYIDWSNADLTKAKVENDGANIGSTGGSTVVTFELSNTTEQAYVLTFATGNKNNSAKIHVQMTASDETVVINNWTVTSEKTGSWTPATVHNYYISNLPIGSYTLTFTTSEVVDYAGNWGNLAFYAASNYDETPGTLDLSNGTYNGPKLENSNTNVGYIKNGSYAVYHFNNGTAGVYQMAMDISRFNTGVMNVKVVDCHSGDTELDYDYDIPSTSDYETKNIMLPGKLTTGIKTMTLTFTSASDGYICNYKAPTFTKEYDDFSTVSAVDIDEQTVTAGATSDWYCALPVSYDATTTFSVTKSNGTVAVSAKDGSDEDVEVTDNGNGTYTIDTPAMGTTTTVTIILTPTSGNYAPKTTYTFKIFRIGEMSLTDVKVDGVSVDVLDDINTADGFSATYSDCYTTAPTVTATQIDEAAATVDAPSISGSTYTYSIHGSMAGGTITRDYTLVLDNVHVYAPAVGDESVNIKANEGTIESNTWSNGVYTLATTSLDSYNQFFKMNGNSYTISVPSDVKVKQLVLKDLRNNYATKGAYVATVSSTGATTYLPVKNQIYHTSEGSAYDLIINLDDHIAGNDISFTMTATNPSDIGQPMAWIQLTTVKSNPGTVPEKTGQRVTIVNNHAVVAVTFDREIPGNVTASINGGTVTAEGGASTLYFPIWDLNYSTNYTLNIAAGAVEDNYGNTNSSAIEIAVNVPTKAAVTQAAYDYVVSDADELKDAITAVTASNSSKSATRKTIFLKNGDYDLGSSESTIQWVNANNVSFIGESRDGVIIHGTSTGISNPVLNLRYGQGFYLQDLTVKNDYDYGTGEFNGVSVAIYGGDKTVMKNVRMLSNQDTQVTGDRAYFEDCKIHGTVDFICGGGDNFYYHTDLILENRGGNVIVAPSTNSSQKWGYVFQECTIKAVDATAATTNAGSYYLGRPWQNEPRSYFLNTTMNVLPNNDGWAGMGNLPTHFYEYNSKNSGGDALDLSVRKNSPTSTNRYTPVLSVEEAAKFTLRNVLGGTDSWLPTDECPTLSAPASVSISGTTLSWDAVSDARCYVIFKDDAYYANQTGTSLDLTETGVYTIKAANLNGGLGTVSSSATYAAVTLDDTEDYTAEAVAHAKVTLRRSISADKWATIVLPFAMTSDQITSAFGENVMVAELTDASTADVLKFSTVTEMTANQPYAIKVSSSDSYSGSAIISGVTIAEAPPTQSLTNWSFVGTYASGNIPANSYFFSSNQLWKAEDGTNTIKPFRAYFTPNGAGAREVKFVIDDDETTAIGTIKADGTMDVIADGKVYNLNGQRLRVGELGSGMRVNRPAKGLYIVNGKKMIIK